MLENKFTPGPWYAVEYAGKWSLQDGPFYDDQDLLDEENFEKGSFANAQLAAAAPDLLEALKQFVFWADNKAKNPHHLVNNKALKDFALEDARKAIAKALGSEVKDA